MGVVTWGRARCGGGNCPWIQPGVLAHGWTQSDRSLTRCLLACHKVTPGGRTSTCPPTQGMGVALNISPLVPES